MARGRTAILALASLLALALLVAVTIKWAPQWLAAPGLHGTARAEELGRVRTALLALLAGIVAVAGAYYTARTFALNRQGQITERFTRAVDQLGHSEIEVRLGGIYALERLARESRDDVGPIVEILTAFVRENAPWPPREDAAREQRVVSSVVLGSTDTERSVPSRPRTDVQAVLTVLGRREPGHEVALRLDHTELSGASLRGARMERVALRAAHLERADLEGAHLEHTDLNGAHLEAAKLSDAHLEDATLLGTFIPTVSAVAPESGPSGGGTLRRDDVVETAHLEGATLLRAHLERADLTGAHLERAVLSEAHLTRATLTGAGLRLAHLNDADLTDANLTQAVLEGTQLIGADLRSACLRKARVAGANFTRALLDGADLSGIRYDETTVWPQGFDPVSYSRAPTSRAARSPDRTAPSM